MDLSNEMQKETKEENKDNAPKQTKKELFAELDKLRNEINSSRNELNRINDQKESWFRKKEDLSSTIRKNIAQIKENKKKRDSLTKNVKYLKEKRNKFNEETRKKISEVQKLKDELKNLTKRSKIKNPGWIKGDIDKIEVKLETEAMPFEKEKELSKKLKQLKKLLGEASAIVNVLDKIKKLNSEINICRKNTDETHNKVQKIAQASQELHEDIIKNSKGTDKVEFSEEEAFKIFLDFKKKFNTINNGLKEKLIQMNTVRNKINQFKLEEEEKRRLKERMLIKAKEHEIEEKIKTGKKLTTEDFLVFQEAIKNNKDI